MNPQIGQRTWFCAESFAPKTNGYHLIYLIDDTEKTAYWNGRYWSESPYHKDSIIKINDILLFCLLKEDPYKLS